MPATESTWRNPNLLHRLFAVTGVLLTIATLWMFQADFTRSWKQYQAKVVNVDLKMNQWRQEQFQTEAALREHATLSAAVQKAQSQAVDQQLLAEFEQEVTRDAEDRKVSVSFASVRELNDRLIKEAKDAADKRQAAEQAAMQRDAAAAAAAAKSGDETLAEQAAAAAQTAADREKEAVEAETVASKTRNGTSRPRGLLQKLADFVSEAKIRETQKLTERKFKSANLDAARANLDIAIRDNADQGAPQARIDKLADEYSKLNLDYQSLSAHRKKLDGIYKQMIADSELAAKSLADSLAGLDRLKTTYHEKDETYFVGQFPFLGKKFITFPIIDAFMSPRRPENLWAEGLTQDYNFSKVRRFDRCTTCHGSMQKSLPGAATSPAYVAEQNFEMQLPAIAPEQLPKPKLDADGEPLPADIIDVLGIRLASEGLIDRDDATVSFVQPNSPGAKAQVLGDGDGASEKLAADIRRAALQLTGPGVVKAENYPRLPGLLVGDVITSINGSDQYGSAQRMAAALIDLAQAGKSIRIGVRRGLPNPYNSHPRLDLFVSDSSPHAMGKFACTICHEGQGSSTSFEYASHTPSTMLDMKRWQNEYGWFDNHHWIYPMNAERFAESSCLKCHHNVVELEPSDRFPEAPAPKVVHGYHLVQKYGCYGCHEINGNDGPTRRIGPDLRLEPNYFAAGQELLVESRLPTSLKKAEAGHEESAGPNAAAAEVDELIELAQSIVKRPEDDTVRNKLRTLIEADAQKEPAAQLLSADTHKTAALLRDVETPGKQRKPGPSLRYFNAKLDYSFAYDWINNPKNFRPSTRMPRFFGLWNHLEGEGSAESLHKAEGIEPIEIRGTIAYLSSSSQAFEPTKRPEGMGEWSDDEKLARGKKQFETRGCLACHSHKDFPSVENFRKPNEIVQGPDLSGVGSKFERQYNPAGPEWLYSWIKDPTKYHPRTLMPVLYLDPEQDAAGKWFDPADDIATYLLSASHIDWKPVEAAKPVKELSKEQRQSMNDLLTEYLNESFYSDKTDDYIKHGIPPSQIGSLKGAEMELIVDRKGMTEEQMKSPEFQAELTDKQLRYIGKRTINKFGCFGCHDIPGFEDAKPIGTALADWGRKDPSKLAFEHISHYIEHGHGHSHAAGHGGTQASTAAGHASQDVGAADAGSSPVTAHPADRGTPTDAEMLADADRIEHGEAKAADTAFYNHHILGGSRIGFLWQKLKEPRSYDYEKTANKKYNERLRMPQFPFDAEEREAVATFVLGLTADPPQAKYVFSPNPRMQAVQAGRQVLDKFNCAGCHILSGDKLQLTFNEGEIGPQSQADMYPFLQPDFAPKAIAASAVADRRGQFHALAEGIPSLLKDGLPRVLDEEGAPIEGDEPYNSANVAYGFDLVKPTILGGNPYVTGQSPLTVLNRQIDNRYPSQGGVLTKYLLPRVTAMELEVNPNASGAEAYGWLPPPLMGEGGKVQPGWLHDFLLEPYKIRPATVLRMPKFNMSKDEASKLVNYFAALDNAEYPYEMSPSRDDAQLARRAGAYGGEESARFDDAMRIVVDNNYCVKCHQVGDFRPPGSPRALAPNLAEVYGRLRPDYLRDWIANPKAILPYTPMPVNIPYKPMEPHLGGVSQELYHGTSVEQVEGLVDLLMNFDRYTRGQTKIAERVKPPAPAAPPAEGDATPEAEAPVGDSATN